MSIVQLALKKPFTIAALVILIVLLGAFSARRMPTDIFPEIDIPVVSVVWAYGGMSATEIESRIVNLHVRTLASAVDDIDNVESTCYAGVGVIRVYLHEGASVSKAITQLAASAQTTLKYMPRGIVPPLVVRYSATDVPVIQLSLASDTMPDVKLNDSAQNIVRPRLAVVHGAEVHTPLGGKPKMIMVDLDMQALQARGMTPAEVTDALLQQNLILPTGTMKAGEFEYSIQINNATQSVEEMNSFPIKRVGDKLIFLRDVGHVHNGFQVQTNAVSVNGLPGAILLVQKTGGVSTLEVIDGVLEQLHDIRALLPKGVEIKPMFDQSFFVKAAIHSVLLGGAIAAGLTGVMILLFLGNWRLTVIIVASIPLSVLTAITIMYAMGESLNTMTLGGFALAVGILVDNATVVIENIERNLGLGKELEAGIVDGAKEVGVPTLVSTLAICIVFVPIFLLEGVAKYLFSPLAVSVIVALLASLAISFTLVPVLFRLLIGPYLRKHGHRTGTHEVMNRLNVFMWAHWAFEAMYNVFRNSYRQYLSWAVHSPWLTAAFFVLLIASAALVYPDLGMDFFPSVDAGQMRLHVRTPPGTRIEQTKAYFADVERAIREITGEDLDVILDNIGLSYSGANIAMSDSATVGPMDGDILIALKAEHKVPTAEYMAQIREELPKKFPQLTMFFQASDIVNQVLNFGLPAPIDVRVGGPDDEKNYAAAQKILRAMRGIPGVVDAHIYQVPDAPAIRINVDRTLARTRGLTQSDIARSVLVSLSSSAAVSPTFWINPANGVSYPLVVQTPQYKIDNVPQLQLMPVTGSDASMGDQVLLGVASLERRREPLVRSATNLLPIYDIHANVQGRDLQAVAADLDEVVKANRPEDPKIKVFVSGQITTMRTSFIGLTAGMAAAVILVYLLMVMNFQSWLDPLIVLMAVPCALAGVVWMLYGTGTHVSVPALMGALMCIGLTTANSILVVAFARQQLALGETPLVAAVAAGYTRLRPVIMTAGAMILGMVPMALGIGEGGEQNAPLGRAVIGGLIFATIATLLFVPAMFRLMHSKKTAVNTDDAPARIAHA